MANYPFNEIIVMSLARTPEREWAWRGAAAIMGIDPEVITVALGKDNKDFNNDSTEVATAAADDGFPFIVEYAKDTEARGTQQTPATVCQIWNYCRILRELIERDQTSLIIFDDKMLKVEFPDFCRLIEEVQDVSDEEFYAIQLNLRGHPSELNLPEIDLDRRIQTSIEVFQGAFGSTVNNLKDVFFRKGIAGYDESILFSPAGAEWMLKCLDLAPDYYQYLDHFICEAMPNFAESAIKRNKGIYCPAEYGYQFVNVFMAMGTTTDWATEASPSYERSKATTPVNYFFEEDSSASTTSARDRKPEEIRKELEKVLETS